MPNSAKEVKMMFPLSRVQAFRHTEPDLRYGQQFHQYMDLNKCTQDRLFCDQLYNATNEAAKRMIDSRTDHDA